MKKRILAMLLAMMLVISGVPAIVSAADDTQAAGVNGAAWSDNVSTVDDGLDDGRNIFMYTMQTVIRTV